MGFIIIKATYPNEEEARKAVNVLLEKKIISSANFFPIRSASRWTGEINEVDEFIVLFKTRKENWDLVRTAIEEAHPYKVSCIAKIDAEANEVYENWVNDNSKP